MIAGIKSSPVITDLDIKHLSFHALTPHDHPYCLHLPFHIDISHISLTNMYLSSELQHQVDMMPYLNSVPQSKRSHLNLVSPLPQRASIPTSPSCLRPEPRCTPDHQSPTLGDAASPLSLKAVHFCPASLSLLSLLTYSTETISQLLNF